jgi:hypothetical protein
MSSSSLLTDEPGLGLRGSPALSRGLVFLVTSVVLATSLAPARGQPFVIGEFLAANATGARDEDGEFSDWIEIYNLDSLAASLGGWYLTDARQDLTKWQFPAVTVPGNSAVVVFASGKDRRNATGKLHTNFKLDRAGEYLALVRPDGVTVASEFAPSYPSQVTDVAYGRVMTTQTNQWVTAAAVARFLVPTNGLMGQSWTQRVFDDSAWAPVTLGIGYYRSNDVEIPPEPGVPLEDLSQPGDLLVPTSANSPGNEGVGNAIDNTSGTKYLNFDKLNAGFTVTLSAGRKVIVGLRLTSANDAPDRDPTSYLLSGSNDGLTWTKIASNSIPDFTARFYTVAVSFTNTVAYSQYRLLFPTIRDAASAVAMQIAEVEFLGLAGDTSVGLMDWVNTIVEAALYGRCSAYVRLPFVVPDSQQVGPLTLRMRYDDGFVAFLNGTEVARANAPQTLMFDGLAPTNRYRYRATAEQRFDLSLYAALVQAGTNMLAIQGFNDRTNSPDFLLQAQLETARLTLGDTAYFQAPTPGAINGPSAAGLVSPVEAFPKRGFFEGPLSVVLYCPTPNASIYYTTNGSVPTAANGTLCSGPIYLDGTTTLRAGAFAEGWVPSVCVTHTYIVLNDVVAQTRSSALSAGFPTNWNAQLADYGLDPRVVGPGGTDNYGGKYSGSLESDLGSIPSLSIVMDLDDWFGTQGIYSNPTMDGDAWERPASIEFLDPANQEELQENAGVCIQGGAFRRFDLTLKKSLRVIFSEKYGTSSLHYPLFGTEATDRFDTFTLRAGANDAWPYFGSGAVYVRDAFAMDSARAMGMIASQTAFVHLYLNGQYWGLYNPVERPDASFCATYLGGNKEDWDALNQGELISGTRGAWDRLFALLDLNMSNNTNYQRLQGNNPDGSRNPAYENLLNVPSLIDYMILNFYIGNADWPGRNWWVGRDRNDGDGFHFFPWDSETALDIAGVSEDRTGVTDSVARPYAAVRTNADFRILFADRVYRHFYNGGPFYVNPTNSAWNPAHPENNRPAERFAAVAERVSRAIVGESARWGDQLGTGPYTRDEHWQTRRDSILRSYFPYRTANVLAQFRQAGLYPTTEPPLMNQHGGVVSPGFKLILSAPQGVIYYTTNGTDPRVPITGLPNQDALPYGGPITVNDLLIVSTRVLNGPEWSALNEATFVVGTPLLLVSELQYHPADPTTAERALGFTDADQFEFIELFNPGQGTFDLNGVEFINGVGFSFTNSALNTLPAGQYLLVVRNRAAFEARYGTGLPVVGEYSGQFNNAGERVTVVDGQGATLIDFTYGTTLPWSTTPDGSGVSLEVIDPRGNLNMPANWHPGVVIGGSPGEPNPVPAPTLAVDAAEPDLLRIFFDGRGGSAYTVYFRDSFSSGSWQVWQQVSRLFDDQPVEISVPLTNAPSSRFFRVSTP